jgi:hypothetical protein
MPFTLLMTRSRSVALAVHKMRRAHEHGDCTSTLSSANQRLRPARRPGSDQAGRGPDIDLDQLVPRAEAAGA